MSYRLCRVYEKMNITDLNIKLLLTFEAMVIHRNVTAAAESIGLTQPAMSVCLKKLRDMFSDPLFVRTSHGMEPTAFAQELKEPILEALGLLRKSLNHDHHFDPATSTRTFHIIMTDIGARVFLPAMLMELSRVAPNVNLNTAQLPVRDIREALETGKADLALGFIHGLFADSYQQQLFRRSYVCIVRRDHPKIKDTITLDDYLNMPHAVVSAPGSGHDIIESTLVKKGYQRRVALRLSHFLAIPLIVASTDLIVTIPTMLAESYSIVNNIKVIEPPIEFPEYTISQYWHARVHNDPGHRWLRELVYRMFHDKDPTLEHTRFEFGL
ncbi:LysR family transcriptional regulator [Pusillimonas sp. DMV24BSW_D]|uniref:LysR family transcriptional regulator n=1 Tax=Neopusillimonas aestuarii TaxID=2716226 RepID=UPI001407CFC1|nr:LysR family transcriptional regulator [Pusillimonas sp. DMV24BSW_D]QIM48000.1 LysR family transcriptional regulator [Pusillimonas sp. DMV24BSW_D]